jgi:hypothetical protein
MSGYQKYAKGDLGSGSVDAIRVEKEMIAQSRMIDSLILRCSESSAA